MDGNFHCNRSLFLMKEAYLLIVGHHALALLLKCLKPVRKVYVPVFTCGIVHSTIAGCELECQDYHINSDLEIAEDLHLEQDEYLIYTNYFGIKDDYIRKELPPNVS